jgi:hypothetical protein
LDVSRPSRNYVSSDRGASPQRKHAAGLGNLLESSRIRELVGGQQCYASVWIADGALVTAGEGLGTG